MPTLKVKGLQNTMDRTAKSFSRIGKLSLLKQVSQWILLQRQSPLLMLESRLIVLIELA